MAHYTQYTCVIIYSIAVCEELSSSNCYYGDIEGRVLETKITNA